MKFLIIPCCKRNIKETLVRLINHFITRSQIYPYTLLLGSLFWCYVSFTRYNYKNAQISLLGQHFYSSHPLNHYYVKMKIRGKP